MVFRAYLILSIFLFSAVANAAYEGWDCRALKREAQHWANKLNSAGSSLESKKGELSRVSDELREYQLRLSSTTDSLSLINNQITAWKAVAENSTRHEAILKKFKHLLTRVDENVPDIVAEIEDLKAEIDYERGNIDQTLYDDLTRSLEDHKRNLENLASTSPDEETIDFLSYLSELNEKKVSTDLQLMALEEEKIKLEGRYKAEKIKVDSLSEQKQKITGKVSGFRNTKAKSRKKFDEVKIVRDRVCNPAPVDHLPMGHIIELRNR